MEINGYKYFAPLSSFKDKHKRIKEGVDFIKIKDYADTLDDTLSDKIIALLKVDPSMKQELLAEKAKVSLQPLSER